MMVPAVTINPQLNLLRAKSLASPSVANVLVKRGCRRFDSVPSVGTSKVDIPSVFHARDAARMINKPVVLCRLSGT